MGGIKTSDCEMIPDLIRRVLPPSTRGTGHGWLPLCRLRYHRPIANAAGRQRAFTSAVDAVSRASWKRTSLTASSRRVCRDRCGRPVASSTPCLVDWRAGREIMRCLSARTAALAARMRCELDIFILVRIGWQHGMTSPLLSWNRVYR